MIHDDAERLALAWVKELRIATPGITPVQAMGKMGINSGSATWDSVTCEWAARWLAAARAQRIP